MLFSWGQGAVACAYSSRDFLAKINSGSVRLESVRKPERSTKYGYPPPPLDFYKISGISHLRNFDRQNCWQNTYSKDFARQNAESMGFTRRFLIASLLAYVAAYAPFAGTMMDRIRGCAQGRMSQGGCGFCWSVASEKILERPVCRGFLPKPIGFAAHP